jgi:hypothetical protein
MAYAQSPCRIFGCRSDGKFRPSDANHGQAPNRGRDADGQGNGAAANVSKLGIREGANLGSILCAAHFLSPCLALSADYSATSMEFGTRHYWAL